MRGSCHRSASTTMTASGPIEKTSGMTPRATSQYHAATNAPATIATSPRRPASGCGPACAPAIAPISAAPATSARIGGEPSSGPSS